MGEGVNCLAFISRGGVEDNGEVMVPVDTIVGRDGCGSCNRALCADTADGSEGPSVMILGALTVSGLEGFN